MPAHARIELNPKVMQGKPVIRGTRIMVELILRRLGEGATYQELLEAYPHLTTDDIHAAVTHAAETVGTGGNDPLRLHFEREHGPMMHFALRHRVFPDAFAG